MKNKVALSELKPGQRAVVQALHNTGGIRRRLRDIGLIENTPVECVGSGSSGAIAAYYIRGAVIALRCEDSGKIDVIPL